MTKPNNLEEFLKFRNKPFLFVLDRRTDKGIYGIETEDGRCRVDYCGEDGIEGFDHLQAYEVEWDEADPLKVKRFIRPRPDLVFDFT